MVMRRICEANLCAKFTLIPISMERVKIKSVRASITPQMSIMKKLAVHSRNGKNQELSPKRSKISNKIKLDLSQDQDFTIM